MKKLELRQIIREEISKLVSTNEITSKESLNENIKNNAIIPVILNGIVENGNGPLIGFYNDEEEDFDVYEWYWDNKPYRVLTNGIYFIVFLEPKNAKLLYDDAIDWHPQFEKFQSEFDDEVFKIALERILNNNDSSYLDLMINKIFTGTTDEYQLLNIKGKKYLLYFFNI